MVKGAFHSTQNSGNFIWYIKWKGQFRFGPTGIFGTSFEGGPLWPVWSFRSVGPKFPFPFDKIVVPNTALLYPAYKNNNQTRCGLGRVCVTGKYRSIGNVEFPKFQTANFCWSESTHSLHYIGLKCLQGRICNRERKKIPWIFSNLPSIKIGTYYTHGPNTLLLIKHGSVQLPGLGSKTVVVLVNWSLLGESTNETIYSKKKGINLGFWETAHLPLP